MRTQYRKVFCVDNLRECLTQERYDPMGMSCMPQKNQSEDDQNHTVEMVGTFLMTGWKHDLFSDITEKPFQKQIPHMLYRKNFDRIEIIDGQRDCVNWIIRYLLWRGSSGRKRSVIPVMLLKL